MDRMIVARSTNLYLRLPEMADIPTLQEWEQSPEVMLVSEDEKPTQEEWANFISSNQERLSEQSGQRLIIELNNGKAIGTVEVFEYMDMLKTAGLGILIADKAERGKGYALESLQLFINYLRKEFEMESLYCNVAESNAASLSLFERAGFVTAGLYPWRNRKGEEENVYHLQMNWL